MKLQTSSTSVLQYPKDIIFSKGKVKLLMTILEVLWESFITSTYAKTRSSDGSLWSIFAIVTSWSGNTLIWTNIVIYNGQKVLRYVYSCYTCSTKYFNFKHGAKRWVNVNKLNRLLCYRNILLTRVSAVTCLFLLEYLRSRLFKNAFYR